MFKDIKEEGTLSKKLKGQFFTITNPFYHQLFFKWLELIPNVNKQKFLEPFCGTNNITIMLEEFGLYNEWGCFDFDKTVLENNQNDKHEITIRDTLNDFPVGYDVAITNPPYLAKNSATRSGLTFPQTHYDDLYKLSLDRMLEHCSYVAAIVPESFITQGLFHNRLFGVVSLNCKMFTDTDCPVCLALFVPDSDDFAMYVGETEVGYYKKVKEYLILPKSSAVMSFNNVDGQVGIIAIDNTVNDSIAFVKASAISAYKVKPTSRALTRVKVETTISEDVLIAECNKILKAFRSNTSDMFLTSFKGLRKDGRYRRRLDYKTVRKIIDLAIENIEGGK